MTTRILLAAIFVACACLVGGCKSPLVEISRTGPLINRTAPFMQINDSSTGNRTIDATIPLK